jgi:hypothetical protein
MRILITNECLDQRAGSDSHVRDLARALYARGHFVFTYSSDLRQGPRLLENDPIVVATDLEALRFKPDIIHARHHLDALTAVMALPGVPAVHHCVGPASRVVLPIHPRIHRYIAPSVGIAKWIMKQDVAEGRLDILYNPIDPLRFTRVRSPAPRPRQVLIYDDQLRPDSPSVTIVQQAADELGLEFGLIGRHLGRVINNPEVELLDYDIVCASGRAALEAVACGCVVFPIDHTHFGEMIDETNFDLVRQMDFSLDDEAPSLSKDAVIDAFTGYTASNVAALAAKVRATCDLASYAEKTEAVYQAAITKHEHYVDDIEAELHATSGYLQQLLLLLNTLYKPQPVKGVMPATAAMFRDVSVLLSAIQIDLTKPYW